MSYQPNRSEQVVADFRQRKLARSAFGRIQLLLLKFEAEHAFDRRAARFGVIALAALLAVGAYLLFSGDNIILR